MTVANPTQTENPESFIANPMAFRRAMQGSEPIVLTDIYQVDTNIAIWERQLSPTLQVAVKTFLAANPKFQLAITVTPHSALANISEALGTAKQAELSENITQLVEMFCDLFELERVGLRLRVLDTAMCPKFHVDRVPCRLVTTYQGVATEWLSHQAVDRSKLGLGSNGKADSESGLYQHPRDIHQISSGHVALLKGELWEGNENAGLVHRSPTPSTGERRLLLTLDFIN